MVLISTTTFILQTLPELQDDDEYPIMFMALNITDKVVIGFFTIEYLVRLFNAPKKLKFLFRYELILLFMRIVILYESRYLMDKI